MRRIFNFIKNLFTVEYYNHNELENIRRENELNRYYYLYMNSHRL